MGKSTMMGMSNKTTNNQTGGGPKKQGLPPTVGLGHFSFNVIKKKAGYCLCLKSNTKISVSVIGLLTGGVLIPNVINASRGDGANNRALINKIDVGWIVTGGTGDLNGTVEAVNKTDGDNGDEISFEITIVSGDIGNGLGPFTFTSP